MSTVTVKTKRIQHRENLPVYFTEKEMLALGKDMAQCDRDLTGHEDRLKSVTAQIKSEIASLLEKRKLLSMKVHDAYEHRYVDCETVLHDPAEKQKTTYRKDTGERVWVRDMSGNELQETLEFKPAEAAAQDAGYTDEDDD